LFLQGEEVGEGGAEEGAGGLVSLAQRMRGQLGFRLRLHR
jgi:hypothetical protein